ncbi:hypothetical protein [Marinomonas ostreistagni]|uniref:hypothetical protein n=1 Tax=Marinomonas ostreistagni TaxID=359209 RepID=UPI0019500BF7|nr:hypothetical protein [Marinomonas ostreistagni]MBM6550934.1 hypothetical protein [Marinomonas ostreistagni]
MLIFTRPKLLLWRDQCWQVMTLAQALASSPTPPALGIDEAIAQLKTLPKTCLRWPICLPDEWLSNGVYTLEPRFPSELYPMAAHTYSGHCCHLLETERVTSFSYRLTERQELRFAVLPKAVFEQLSELTRAHIMSEGLLRHGQASRWRTLLRNTSAFEPFSSHYIEQRKQQRQRRQLVRAMAGLAVLTILLAGYMYSTTPVAQWPATALDTGAKVAPGVLDSLTYIRSLPPQVRVDQLQVSTGHVQLALSGNAQDITLWQQQWPAHLPPLTLTLSTSGEQP